MSSSLFEPAAAFGEGLAVLGDVNGDALNDIAVGMHLDDAAGLNDGSVHILLMAADDTVKTHTRISRAAGEGFPGLSTSQTFLGQAIAALSPAETSSGPVDLVIALPASDMLVLLPLNSDGKAGGNWTVIADGRGGVPVNTIEVESKFGIRMANIGDIDGDGQEDLAVGAN